MADALTLDMQPMTLAQTMITPSAEVIEAYERATRLGIQPIVDKDGWTRYDLGSSEILFIGYCGCFVSKDRDS